MEMDLYTEIDDFTRTVRTSKPTKVASSLKRSLLSKADYVATPNSGNLNKNNSELG